MPDMETHEFLVLDIGMLYNTQNGSVNRVSTPSHRSCPATGENDLCFNLP